MNLRIAVLPAFAALLSMACGSAQQQASAPMDFRVNAEPGGAVSGSASVVREGGSFSLRLKLEHLAPWSSHAAQIALAGCGRSGKTLARLNSVTADASGAGSSTSDVSQPYVGDGWSVVVGAGTGVGNAPPVACGALARTVPPIAAVAITARDYAFDAPPEIPAGLVSLTLTNQGQAPHSLAFWRLHRPDDAAELQKALSASSFSTAVPADGYGGITATAPHGSKQAVLDLPEGTYLLTSLVVADDGRSDVSRGTLSANIGRDTHHLRFIHS